MEDAQQIMSPEVTMQTPLILKDSSSIIAAKENADQVKLALKTEMASKQEKTNGGKEHNAEIFTYKVSKDLHNKNLKDEQNIKNLKVPFKIKNKWCMEYSSSCDQNDKLGIETVEGLSENVTNSTKYKTIVILEAESSRLDRKIEHYVDMGDENNTNSTENEDSKRTRSDIQFATDFKSSKLEDDTKIYSSDQISDISSSIETSLINKAETLNNDHLMCKKTKKLTHLDLEEYCLQKNSKKISLREIHKLQQHSQPQFGFKPKMAKNGHTKVKRIEKQKYQLKERLKNVHNNPLVPVKMTQTKLQESSDMFSIIAPKRETHKPMQSINTQTIPPKLARKLATPTYKYKSQKKSTHKPVALPNLTPTELTINRNKTNTRAQSSFETIGSTPVPVLAVKQLSGNLIAFVNSAVPTPTHTAEPVDTSVTNAHRSKFVYNNQLYDDILMKPANKPITQKEILKLNLNMIGEHNINSTENEDQARTSKRTQSDTRFATGSKSSKLEYDTKTDSSDQISDKSSSTETNLMNKIEIVYNDHLMCKKTKKFTRFDLEEYCLPKQSKKISLREIRKLQQHSQPQVGFKPKIDKNGHTKVKGVEKQKYELKARLKNVHNNPLVPVKMTQTKLQESSDKVSAIAPKREPHKPMHSISTQTSPKHARKPATPTCKPPACKTSKSQKKCTPKPVALPNSTATELTTNRNKTNTTAQSSFETIGSTQVPVLAVKQLSGNLIALDNSAVPTPTHTAEPVDTLSGSNARRPRFVYNNQLYEAILMKSDNKAITQKVILELNLNMIGQTNGILTVVPSGSLPISTPIRPVQLGCYAVTDVTHSVPLPTPPVSQLNIAGTKPIPPRPHFSIGRSNGGIVLSWKMPYNLDEYETITSYQLYAYHETPKPQSSDNWKKVCDMKGSALPMECTLIPLGDCNKYHFAMCAVDVQNRMGQFSEPKEIVM